MLLVSVICFLCRTWVYIAFHTEHLPDGEELLHGQWVLGVKELC